MNIWLEKLRAIRTLITHENCPDGIASAMIVRRAIPDVEVVFVQHGSSKLAALKAAPGMLFCDFSPPADRVGEFVEAGAIVLDHHKTARAVVEAFGDSGVFADESTAPGVSGAMLAYEYVWMRLADERQVERDAMYVDDFAQLAGIRDTWQRRDVRWIDACAQAAALSFWPVERLLSLDVREWSDAFAIGHVLLQKRATSVAQRIEQAYRFRVCDVRVVVISRLDETSDVIDALSTEADVVLGFGYHCDSGAPKLVVSCRSRSGIDVAAFARRHGGGGHTQAAGFTVPVALEDRNPYALVRTLVEFWLRQGASSCPVFP